MPFRGDSWWRITLEIEAVAVELREATTSLGITEVTERPLRVTPKLVRQTIDEMTGILEHAPLDTRVAWVRDLFQRIDVDSRESHAVAVWKAATDIGVNRSRPQGRSRSPALRALGRG